MANSVDPDQLASSEANWSGSTLFARTGHVVLSKRRVKYNWWDTVNMVLIFTFPVAVNRINEIIANGMKPKQSRFSPAFKGPRPPVPGPRFDTPPPAIINNQPQVSHTSFRMFLFRLSFNLYVCPAGPSGSVWCGLTDDQEIVGSTPAGLATSFHGDLIMKYFLQSFSPFRWFKKGSCQFLVKECAQYWLTN